MNEIMPNNQEVPKNNAGQVDIEIDIDPAMYIVGANEVPTAEADQLIEVGDYLVKPATSGGQEHIPLPIGEEPSADNSDIYTAMAGGPGADMDQGIWVGENFVKPKTEGRQGHVPLPLGEEVLPIPDIYKRMVSDPNDGRPDISI